jgi:hypothetical protein
LGEKFIRQRREPSIAPLKLCESEYCPQEKSCESGIFNSNGLGEKFIRQRREPSIAPLKLCESEYCPQEKSCESGIFSSNGLGEKFIRQRREPSIAPLKLCESEYCPPTPCEASAKQGFLNQLQTLYKSVRKPNNIARNPNDECQDFFLSIPPIHPLI